MDGDAPFGLEWRQHDVRGIIALAAGDDLHGHAALGQRESEVRQHLAGRGMIGMEEPVDKYDPHLTILPAVAPAAVD